MFDEQSMRSVESMSKDKKYYCPKCGKKKLIQKRASVAGGFWNVWICEAGKPPDNPRWEKNYGPICGLRIQVVGRNAKISDYDDPLGKLAQVAVPSVQQWMLESQPTIAKRGIEVLYEGPLLDVVRRSEEGKLGVGLYWRAQTWDPSSVNPFTYMCLSTESANHVFFENIAVRTIFEQGNGFDVWRKDSESHIFTGNLGKKLKKGIVGFAQRLEKALPELITKCDAEFNRWQREKQELVSTLNNIKGITSDGVTVRHYNGHTKTAKVVFRRVTPEEALEVSEIITPVELTLPMLSTSPFDVTPQQAIDICKITGEQATFEIAPYYSGTFPRLTSEQAQRIARLLVRA